VATFREYYDQLGCPSLLRTLVYYAAVLLKCRQLPVGQLPSAEDDIPSNGQASKTRSTSFRTGKSVWADDERTATEAADVADETAYEQWT
jgi:hypothetical protein